MNGRLPVIFCDFDGTITENDNIIAIMKHFNPPGWDSIVQQILDKTISIQEGVGRLFALMPSSQKSDIMNYAINNARIRQGFDRLLAFCREQNIEFLVTSGGIDFFVYPLLAPFNLNEQQIFCNSSDFTGEHLQIGWPHPCDEACENGACGMCKTKIIRSYPNDRYYRILIGDSITDFAGSKLVDTVFARSHLALELDKLGKPYFAYEDFDRVIDDLQQLFHSKED